MNKRVLSLIISLIIICSLTAPAYCDDLIDIESITASSNTQNLEVSIWDLFDAINEDLSKAEEAYVGKSIQIPDCLFYGEGDNGWHIFGVNFYDGFNFQTGEVSQKAEKYMNSSYIVTSLCDQDIKTLQNVGANPFVLTGTVEAIGDKDFPDLHIVKLSNPSIVTDSVFQSNSDQEGEQTILETEKGKIELLGLEDVPNGLLSGDDKGNESNFIFVVFTYTNKENSSKTYISDFWVNAYQNGIELDRPASYFSGKSELHENTYKTIRKGASIKCAEVFKLDDNSPVTVTARIQASNVEIYKEFPLDNSGTSSEVDNNDLEIAHIGDTVSTDEVEFIIDECRFTDKVGLTSSDWLKPTNGHKGLVPSDGETFVWIHFTAKNLSKHNMSGYDVTDIHIEYDDGYIYDDTTFTDGTYGWSTSKGISTNQGLVQIKPLGSHEYYGTIKCIDEVKTSREKPLRIVIILPSSTGNKTFIYDYSAAAGANTSEEALAISNAFHDVLDDLAFVKKYAGQSNNNGSRKFADSMVQSIRHGVDEIDAGFVQENFQQTANALPGIKNNLIAIADLLDDMGRTNSDANVSKIKQLCSDTAATIENLLNTDYKAFN